MHNSCSNVNENKLNIENFVILEKEKLSDNRSSFKEKSSIDKMTSIVHSRFYRQHSKKKQIKEVSDLNKTRSYKI